MQYISFFDSPLGKLYLTADDDGLTGLVFEQDEGNQLPINLKDVEFNDEQPDIMDAKLWLSLYFAGSRPDFTPKLSMKGSEFRMDVWDVLKDIPYGETMTYGDIAKLVGERRGTRASAQAVGGAVGHNPIAIIVPCHRVLGAGKAITGYTGGLDKKRFLLDLEKIVYNE
ncbi:Methylated-DNA--protein-cysteine methyltransferase [Anaerovibrio sp. JC8]|uniref:methylated-DNA--[protein]-cysteine S-methyltransferase n=1 Tax=Anaerovibrio sp. JC8 TaxID=1240085 RepID=UPI000A0D6AD4|nr:methylated-DNA--[protein]-cysteine S-methyltransferase [Anaerovibrio sp. JC8]ORU00012.1 Methylated-DNA--protein-cysteine methyltransferase [Anaerovibrio sp. JC8]